MISNEPIPFKEADELHGHFTDLMLRHSGDGISYRAPAAYFGAIILGKDTKISVTDITDTCHKDFSSSALDHIIYPPNPGSEEEHVLSPNELHHKRLYFLQTQQAFFQFKLHPNINNDESSSYIIGKPHYFAPTDVVPVFSSESAAAGPSDVHIVYTGPSGAPFYRAARQELTKVTRLTRRAFQTFK